MSIPLITAGAAAVGAAIHAWFSGDLDAWHDTDVFNARMRDMQSLALALNDAFAHCPEFMKDTAQLTAWRGTRDGFSKFYRDTGTLTFSPDDAEVEQAKAYANRFAAWSNTYDGYKCGKSLTNTTGGGIIPPPESDDSMAPLLIAGLIGAGAMMLFLLPPRRANPRAYTRSRRRKRKRRTRRVLH